MSIQKISIETYFASFRDCLLVDVRSPGEYFHAHIPEAVSLPLFSDEERKVVGTAYKQQSREKAIKIGLQYFGPKMVEMIGTIEKLLTSLPLQPTHVHDKGKVVVHCWRGGMRSAGVAWLLDLYGFQVFTIEGGYKAFRQWALGQFTIPHSFRVLGGHTGSAKTEVLQAMAAAGAKVIDLEQLASHKGSAFGNINMPPQPSQEMFENKLALALCEATAGNPAGKTEIWVEDESQRIGDLNIPLPLFKCIRQAPLLLLEVPFEKRLDHIVSFYGKGNTEKLVNAIIRIQKRLGGLETKNAIQHILEGNLKESFRILLTYYDKWYDKGVWQYRDPQIQIPEKIKVADMNPDATAKVLMSAVQSYINP